MEKKSSIIAIGLSVHQTPVDIREQLSIAEVRQTLQVAIVLTSQKPADRVSSRLHTRPQQLKSVVALLNCWRRRPDLSLLAGLQAEWPRAIAELVAYPHIEEAAVLSTCNRMELYVVALSRNRVRLLLLEPAAFGS